MASRLRIPALALATLSIGLNIAIIGCAARTLHVFQSERSTNAYFLPIWNDHFDTRQLSALIGTSTVISILNVVLVAALFIAALPANLLILTSTTLATLLALIAIIFSSVLNTHAPRTDTLLTWTCRWKSTPNGVTLGVPQQFNTLCNETRFAFYTTIPSFLIQLLLLTLAIFAIFSSPRPSSTRGMRLEEGKDHEMGTVRQQSSDSKNGSVGSSPISIRVDTKR